MKEGYIKDLMTVAHKFEILIFQVCYILSKY